MLEPAKASHTRFDTLDGMRGVAAICVMLLHYTMSTGHYLANAPVAVDLFFSLSGFVLAHSYGERLRKGTMTLWNYGARRLIRLYPMFLAGILIGLPAFYARWAHGTFAGPRSFVAESALLNAFYLPAFNHYDNLGGGGGAPSIGWIFPVNGPAWSLFFEMIASAAFVLLIRFNRIALVATVALSYVAFLGCGYYHAMLDHRFAIDLELGWSTSDFYGGFPRVLYGFGFGVLIYEIYREERFVNLGKFITRYFANPAWLYVVLVAIFMFPKVLFGLYPAFIILFVVPIIVFAGANITCSGTATTNTTHFLGWISYPIYCLHIPLGWYWSWTDSWKSFWLQLIVSIVLTLAVTIVLTRFYDEPVRAWMSRRLTGRSTARIGG